jgi:hypothetical protein
MPDIPDARLDLGIAMEAMDGRLPHHVDATVLALQALVRLREEDMADRELVNRRLASLEKRVDWVLSELDQIRALWPEGDGR